jgi:hypothetical protein
MKNNIRMFRKDGGFSRWIDDDEARRHLSTQAADEIFDHRYSPPRFLGIQLRDMHQPSLGSSAASITARETFANVECLGVGYERAVDETEKTKPRIPGHVLAARSKIRMWPFEGDTKAVRVGCGPLMARA